MNNKNKNHFTTNIIIEKDNNILLKKRIKTIFKFLLYFIHL